MSSISDSDVAAPVDEDTRPSGEGSSDISTLTSGPSQGTKAPPTQTDALGRLNEMVMSRRTTGQPRFSFYKSGADHKPIFEAEVQVVMARSEGSPHRKVRGVGTAHSKKDAKRMAAQDVVAKFGV